MSDQTVIALCGNPNCGKTTVFNSLTGAKQEVGNWPGVTVERKTGLFKQASKTFQVVDLPGTYSLDVVDESVALDEKIARDYIMSHQADLIVNIVDASNIERNLYLTTQLLQLGKPVVIVLNMMDVAQAKNININSEILAKITNCPVIVTSANQSKNRKQLKAQLASIVGQPNTAIAEFEFIINQPLKSNYEQLKNLINEPAQNLQLSPGWLAVRLMEGHQFDLPEPVNKQIKPIIESIENEFGDDIDITIADARFDKIISWIEQCVSKKGEASRNLSVQLDRLFLNKYLGIPIFLLITYLMFIFTISFGGAFIDFFDQSFQALLVDGGTHWLTGMGLPDWLVTIVANGFGGGIKVVSTFIPIIASLYLFLSVLEDSGYLARGAFVMDRFMQSIGLPGKSFIPLMVGLGCTVPAIYATRSLEYQKDRIITVMMSPFISCGARLPVYILFAAVFFPDNAQHLVFSLYLIGVVIAVLTGLMLKNTLLGGENTPFVMELPAYHMPRLQNVLIKTWEKLSSFIFGAGKLIVIVVVILSFLNSLGTDGSFGNENNEKSVLTNIGKGITPIFEPMGVHEDNWPATVGIFTGLFAKEVVVGTIDSLYSSQLNVSDSNEEFDLLRDMKAALATIPENLSAINDSWSDPVGINVGDVKDLDAIAAEQEVATTLFSALKTAFGGTLAAFSYLLFILLYSPCVSALGATYKETGVNWTVFSILWSTFLAYSIATMVYQAGQIATSPLSASGWIGLFVFLHFVNYLLLKRKGVANRNSSLSSIRAV